MPQTHATDRFLTTHLGSLPRPAALEEVLLRKEMPGTLKFIHLTDPHLVTPGRRLYDLDPQQRLRAAIDSINAEHRDAAFVVVTGDLAHLGETPAYRGLRDELQRLPMPVHLLIGNHDHRERFLGVFDDAPVDPGGFVQHAFSAGGARFVCLDSNEPGVAWGVVCERRALWLAAELETSDPLPVLLFMHHPPFPVGIAAMDDISLRDAGHLRAAIGAHRQRIRHLFFGHLHRPVAGSWQGIAISTVRATSHQVALDFNAVERIAGSHEPPAYAVVLTDADRTIVHLHDFADRSARFAL